METLATYREAIYCVGTTATLAGHSTYVLKAAKADHRGHPQAGHLAAD